jgi:hypothetical protein
LEGKINSHTVENEKRLDRVNEEIRAKKKVLEIRLKKQAEVRDRAIEEIKQSLRQNQGESNNQWIAETEVHQATNVKLERALVGLTDR